MTEGGGFFLKPLLFSNPLLLPREIFRVLRFFCGGKIGNAKYRSESAKVGSLKIFNYMAKKKANNEIDSLKRYIRGILQERDKYSKEMSYQIELLASDLLVFRRIRDEALKEETTLTVIEKSRENCDRVKENPVFILMARYADRVRKDLRSLMMNQEIQPGGEAGKTKEDDPLSRLMEHLNKEDD